MKILHVIPSIDPASGGPPMVATRLAAAQAGLGHEVSIFCYDQPHARARIDQSLAALPHHDRLRFITAGHDGRMESLFGRNARTALDAAAPDHDILHLHGVWGTVMLVAGASARRAGKPYGIAPHGMLYPWSLNQKSLKKRIGLALGYRELLRKATFIHVLNRDEALALPAGIDAPTEVIANGMFKEEFEPLPPPGRFHAAHPELKGEAYVLFLSRLHRGKGLEVLPDAFGIVAKEMPRVHLVIAGPDSGMKDPVVKRVGELNLGERVHLVGPLYGAHKFEALRDAAVFCLPSAHETFSMAILEALACSRPIVLSTECHFPEVPEAGAGRMTPAEAGGVAGAIMEILRDPALAERMGQAGRRLVHERFLWPTIAQAAVDAYQRAMSKRPRRVEGAAA